ncbi:MAG: hypothetical protein KGL11_10935 [Alphaproteobacteria bacterium]|nr:hypothetical protein [Alphaproteobacteria bacterium]
MHITRSTGRDLAISFLVLLGLAIPFMPVPGDHMARVDVRFHTRGMAPHAFSANTLHSICEVMAAALAYNDPRTGQYIRISCRD